jgi:benzil reductase ((S)-benzoin forming)
MKRKLTFITGTTRGLGQALKLQFEGLGWSVIGLNRPAFDLAALDVEGLESIFKSVAASDLSRIVFLNNAATLKIAPANTLWPDDIRREFAVNIVSPIIAIATFLRHFPRGEIANVTSTAASKPVPRWSTYCTAKAALEGYIRALAVEGFKVYSLNPGVIDTDMQAVVRGADFPQVAEFVAMKSEGELKPANDVAKSLVRLIDQA